MKFKKVIALILSVVLSLSVLPIFASAKTTTKNDPVIYIRGDGTELYEADGVTPISKAVDTSKIGDMVKEVFPYFTKCLMGGTDADWEAWEDKFAEVFGSIYENWRPDDDGNITDGSGLNKAEYDMLERRANSDWAPDNRYIYSERCFDYDSRLDPMQNVDRLHEFIEKVKKTTKHDKVQLLIVCFGAQLGSAYIYKYGTDDISSIMFDTPMCNGITLFNGLATGTMQFDGQSLQRMSNDMAYKTTYKTNDTVHALVDFLRITVELCNQYGLVDLFNASIKNNLLKRINTELLPRLLMVSYGTSLSYWASVGDDCFEQAMKNTFGVKDFKTKYATLISRIEDYHNTVVVNTPKILKDAMANGVNVAVIGKYGFSPIPIFDSKDEIGDEFVLCKNSTFGATTSKATKTLDNDYIAKQTAKGLGKYISPDKMVDASTCISPDRTWIVKGMPHDFTFEPAALIDKYLTLNGNMTVNDDPRWPQYLLLDREGFPDTVNIVPMTKENMNDTSWITGEKIDFKSPKSFVSTVTDWIVSFIKTVKLLFNMIKEKLAGLIKK